MIESGRYKLDPAERDRMIEKFWGVTATYDASRKILDFIKEQSK